MLGFRIVWVGAILGVGAAGLHAQTALVDPKDAPRIFSNTCSACHKSPQGLAKSGQVAGFLRQHYTTGPEMSAAMAAYLVAAGAAPASKKGAQETAAAQKSKSKKQEQSEHAALSPGERAEAAKERSLRGKQRNTKSGEPKSGEPKSHEEAARPSPVPPTPAPSEEIRQAAAPAAQSAPATDTPGAPAPTPAQEPAPPPLVTFNLPLPAMPDAPPADLTQSAFSSSPVP